MKFNKGLYLICLSFFLISEGVADIFYISDGAVQAEIGATAEGDLPDPDMVFSDNFESPNIAVFITSFTATPDYIDVGGNTTLSWSVVNAVSCEATGGTVDWTETEITLPSGSTNIVIDSAGTYTFMLECLGAESDQQISSETVTVSDVPEACNYVTLSGNIVDWGIFWSESFPGPVYENVMNWIIPQKGYLAIKFNSGNVIDDGKISALENASTPGIRTGVISECPGDFNVPEECWYSWGLGGGLYWATNGRSGACDLEPYTNYYFSITFTDGEDPNSSTCDNTPCRINLQHANF